MNKEPEETTAKKGNRYQSAVLVGLVVLGVGLSAACTQYKASTLLPTLATRFAMDANMSAWVMSIFTLVGIFFALPAGGMAQRFGFKKVLLASSGLIIIGSLIGMASGANSAILIVSRAIEGISLTFITTCAPIAIQKCVDPKKVALATGIWGCWGNGGAVIASVLTPHIFGVAGFEGVWLFFAAFALIAAILLLVFIKTPDTEKDPGETALAPDNATDSQDDLVEVRYSELLTKDVILFLCGFAAFNIVMLAILGMLPSVLQLPEKGFTMEMSGFATTFASLLSLISTPLFGAFANRLGKVKPLLLLTFAVLGPCVLIMFTQTNILFWVASGILGIIGFGCVGLLIAGWMEVIPRPELISKAMGVFTLVQCVGQFLGTFLIQLLLGPTMQNWLLTGLVLCAIAILGLAALALAKFR